MLKDEIIPYLQTTGLVSNVVSTGQYRTCDNSPLFTSEYLILQEYLDVSDLTTSSEMVALGTCAGTDGYLHRAPNDTSEDAPDDYHGAFTAYILLGVMAPFGLPFSLWRQPQLIALDLLATRNLLYRVIATPFLAYAALVIATACINDPVTDTDGRVLSWLLGIGTQSSWMCRIGRWFWRRRLMAAYPPTNISVGGMQTVFQTYLGAQHPLAKYMVRY